MFCVGCNALQAPPPAPDLFRIFQLEPRYHLDLADLDDRYRKLARQLHPDRYAGKTPRERQASLQWTAILNEARKVLREPERRARYLATGNPDPQETGGPKLDPVFYEEMIEWREQEAEAPGSVRPLAEAMAGTIEAEIDAIFTAWEARNGTLELVSDRLARLKYVRAILR